MVINTMIEVPGKIGKELVLVGTIGVVGWNIIKPECGEVWSYLRM